ncbi:hypothetical protein OGAPHI_002354 [Ogataea philodendri]|uniref:Phosphatidic acid phosphatase type 2/haloperoxidase domain-containing protein n=1 Tax=Ogataea philodendri TaxID=1378263 RepID=A0A9P8T7W9_9ASCO|nr:uncharacterized protein OGAPHI_002354 [Ogataea philodendri]KAH3668600.1 hypothetical protein OGAPHI_002354 [Ogataea philodendri]
MSTAVFPIFRHQISLWLVPSVFSIVSIFMEVAWTPFHRQFHSQDMRISYPFTPDSIPDSTMGFYVMLCPWMLILLDIVIRNKRNIRGQFRSVFNLGNTALLGLSISLTLTLFLTEVLKLKVGRLRPDFLSRCGLPEELQQTPGLYTIEFCTAPYGKRILEDAFKSWPSGHSSMTWSGLSYTTLWFAGQYKLFLGKPGFRITKFALLAPLLLALHICISRSQDYKHDFIDISCGSVLGFSISWWTYKQFFPPLNSEECDVPLLELGPPQQSSSVSVLPV